MCGSEVVLAFHDRKHVLHIYVNKLFSQRKTDCSLMKLEKISYGFSMCSPHTAFHGDDSRWMRNGASSKACYGKGLSENMKNRGHRRQLS